MALNTHLGYDPRFFRHSMKLASFPNGGGERFFNIDMLAQLHGHHAGRIMGVIGGTDHDGIDLATESIKHGAKIFKLGDVRKLLVGINGAGRVDVTKSYIIIGRQTKRWFAAFAAYANESEIDATIGGRAAGACPHDGRKSPSAGGT